MNIELTQDEENFLRKLLEFQFDFYQTVVDRDVTNNKKIVNSLLYKLYLHDNFDIMNK